MRMFNDDPLLTAANLSNEFATLLEVPDLAEQIAALNNSDQLHTLPLDKRDFDLGNVLGMASLFVGLVGIFLQIRQGNTFQGASRAQIQERLIMKLIEETSLPAVMRERLISQLIETMLVDSNNDKEQLKPPPYGS